MRRYVRSAKAPTPHLKYRFFHERMYRFGCGWYMIPSSTDHRSVWTKLKIKIQRPTHRWRKLKFWYEIPVMSEKTLSRDDNTTVSGINANARQPSDDKCVNKFRPYHRPRTTHQFYRPQTHWIQFAFLVISLDRPTPCTQFPRSWIGWHILKAKRIKCLETLSCTGSTPWTTEAADNVSMQQNTP